MIAMLFATPTRGEGAPEKRLYFWIPSFEDVKEGSERSTILQFLLRNATSRNYRVKFGDYLDRIVRTQFFVYRHNQPNAYGLYLKEIIRRNEKKLSVRIRANVLIFPGETLTLPSGPKYAALQLPALSSKRDEAKYYKVRATRGFGTYRALAKDEFNKRLVSNFGYFVQERDPTSIASLRIAYAVNESKSPEFAYSNYEPVEFEAPTSLPQAVAARSYKAVLPAIANQLINCANPCKSPAQILKSLGGLQESGKLFIADTGVAGEVGAPRRQLIYPLPADPETCADAASNQHGTFVYSETASGSDLFGVLPQGKVYIAKWAVTTAKTSNEEGYEFRLAELTQAINTINAQLTDQDPSTAVVNISASGPAGSGETIPWLPRSPRLLFVAAAGNDGGDEITNSILFAQQDKMALNLLIVGALDEKGMSPASYSNYHPSNVDLFVQGSCVCGHGTQLNGTSQASPLAAVAAAMLAGARPNWDPIHIKWRLISTTTYTPEVEGKAVGGILNFERAAEASIIVLTRPDPNSSTTSPGTQELRVHKLNYDSRWRSDWEHLFINERSKKQVLRLRRIPCPPGTAENRTCFARMTLAGQPEESGMNIASDAQIMLELLPTGTRPVRAEQVDDIILPIFASAQDGRIEPP